MRTAPRADERTDAELVEGILAGSRELFTPLCERYQATLYRYALGMVSRPDVAADLAQDSLVKAYTRLGSCKQPDRFGSWVFRILRNECLDHLKSRRRKDQPLDKVALYAPDTDDPERRLERSEMSRTVSVALQRLPEGFG
ncbi:MAG: sigma-70 family RNA polymerase sigma factor, partial [Gemmatimonadota bacterium]